MLHLQVRTGAITRTRAPGQVAPLGRATPVVPTRQLQLAAAARLPQGLPRPVRACDVSGTNPLATPEAFQGGGQAELVELLSTLRSGEPWLRLEKVRTDAGQFRWYLACLLARSKAAAHQSC